MNLTNLSLQLTGYDITTAKKELKGHQQRITKDYRDYIEEKKAEILAFHLKNNIFYSALVGNKPQNWKQLPVLTKQDLQQPLQNRLSKGFSAKNTHVHKTSGSSGQPFIFAKDKFAHALTWASISDLYASKGLDLNTSHEARFYGIPNQGLVHYKERLKDLLSNRYRFSIFNTSSENFEQFINSFQSNKFGHLNGYTSTLVLFAKYLAEKNLILKDLCPSLTHCIVTAEMLFKEDLKLLKKQFGVNILNEYGSSETGILAFGPAEEALKIDTRLQYIEILDKNNKPVANGTSGKIVVTSLFNKAHPFIRYEIGDLGTLSLVNDQPVLTKLEGRLGDFALLPDGKKIPALAFYYVTKEIIKDTANVKEFVIIQNQPDTFTIDYVADTEFSNAEIEKIKKAITVHLNANLQVVVNKKNSLDRSKRGKLEQFRRTF
ncbi:phenylacetate--CoA ligase family protein [Leeuwenhoekiella marinoflava]|uniref:Phenylacetate-CoA ligase n=2 Tax=Leeuwenhoekiella marinoflava TaxID=988 RepID=A0A4Q0PRR6_9FLAO|nr:phenylacetate--CoA ligase family protein [Leeuwenhoekiella marinoflava]RXG32952.1 phenylacetate-CoA ligase [Leeuwenhoekiella marinoflava]SHE33199.1 phenylacetate-CoA ligase [Leeuwenhoekiella marinoflava DSM 3653]